MTRLRNKGAFTITELLVVIVAVIALVIGVLLAAAKLRGAAGLRQLQDGVCVRGVQQSMAIWASQYNGLYPLPSNIDTSNATVADQGAAKDHTANIYSLLIYTGGISVELLISEAESNTGAIIQDDNYQFDNPQAALNPANAMWDPAFTVDFTGGKVGNASYAHVLPGGTRSPLWRDAVSTTEPVVGNRGPEIKSITRDTAGNAVPAFALVSSNTFLIHGGRNSWEGYVAYNDGHANFETRTDPSGVIYKDAAGKWLSDCLFFDEPDDAAGTNAFMSIWTKAGATNGEFNGIWD